MPLEVVISVSPALVRLMERMIAALSARVVKASKPARTVKLKAPAERRGRKALRGGKRAKPAAKRSAKRKVRAKVTNGWRTADRRAVLAGLWSAGVLRDEIERRFNADGGPPVPAKHLVAVWANELGAARPAGFGKAPNKVAMRPRNEVKRRGVGDEGVSDFPASEEVEKIDSASDVPMPEAVAPAPPSVETPAEAVERALKPAPVPRDAKLGPLSVAARLRAEDDAAMVDCPVTWADALEWAKRHQPEGFDRPRNLDDIQAIRAHHQLPRYRIIRARTPHEELPSTDLIDKDGPPLIGTKAYTNRRNAGAAA